MLNERFNVIVVISLADADGPTLDSAFGTTEVYKLEVMGDQYKEFLKELARLPGVLHSNSMTVEL